MNIFEFMSDSPWLTFFIAIGVVCVIEILFLKVPHIIMRYWNINKHGYPPPHCDADGDFKVSESDD